MINKYSKFANIMSNNIKYNPVTIYGKTPTLYSSGIVFLFYISTTTCSPNFSKYITTINNIKANTKPYRINSTVLNLLFQLVNIKPAADIPIVTI